MATTKAFLSEDSNNIVYFYCHFVHQYGTCDYHFYIQYLLYAILHHPTNFHGINGRDISKMLLVSYFLSLSIYSDLR